MRTALYKTLCLAMVVMPLAFAIPAAAEETGASAAGMESGSEGEWTQDHMARQEYREEMEKIRAEHEELESERDQLKTQCLNVKGQERSACRQKWQDLHQRKDALHDRMKALHEKMAAEHAAHHQWKKDHHKSGTTAPAAPATTAPAQ